LFGIMAREAPVAAVFRRGPSKWCQLIRWDTQTDYVERGQWFHGRVYERRCDLSPDGSLLIYFAMDARWESETKGAWTGVSRLPYWTALTLWPKGDCWNGGGLFIDQRTLWVNCGEGGAGGEPLGGRGPRDIEVVGKHPYMPMPGAECYGVYFPRLVREGWDMGKFVMVDARTTKVTWSKARDGVTLVKQSVGQAAVGSEGKGTYYDTYERVGRDGRGRAMEGVEWADFDQRGRLVFARGGKLWRGRERGAEWVEEMVVDLNDGVPTKERSPEGARSW
jgi:hypothetical protein